MKTLAQLDQLNLDVSTKIQVTDLVQMLLEQSQREARSQQQKSESLSSTHPDLFEETLQSDLAAVNVEIEQLDPSAKANPVKPPRSCAGRQPLPGHCRALNNAMNLNLVNANNAAIN